MPSSLLHLTGGKMEGERRKQHSGKGEAQRQESDSKIQLLAPPCDHLESIM